MVHRIQCSFCGTQYKWSEKYVGRKVKCKECGKPLPVPPKQTSETDAFISALDATVDEEPNYQPFQVHGLPPRAVSSKKKRKNDSSGKGSTLTAQKVYLIQGLVAGCILGGITSLVREVFDYTGMIDLIVNAVLGTVSGIIFGGAVMWVAGKFDSAFAGYITGVLVMVPMTGLEGFVASLIGMDVGPLFIYFVLGVPRGLFCTFLIFSMAKDVDVKEE
jgi:DNA-directed RNA polymerase subunit RPC12/RpoP